MQRSSERLRSHKGLDNVSVREDHAAMTQTTIQRPITYSGAALHSGCECSITLRPAPADTGILFRRIDVEGAPEIAAVVENVVNTDRCTTIGAGNVAVSTIEHLMAALRGMEVDNVVVDIDGPEVPIADGSAGPFVQLIRQAGIAPLDAPRAVKIVEKPTWVRDGNKVAVALPHETFRVSFTFTNDHNHPVLSDLYAEFDVESATFAEEIAPARTIGWLSEVEKLQASGLALGATMDMAVVIGEDRILTPMRFRNEPVRHKVLDVIGDLFLAGFVQAHIICVRSNHYMNTRLAQAITANENAKELTERK